MKRRSFIDAPAAKTAKALGMTIPPSLLQRADQVIEQLAARATPGGAAATR